MSNIKFDKWLNADNTENYKCRAWVNFNGTGTVAIRASGNVSSITDNGTGDYTVNFATAMSDANYEFNLSSEGAGAGNALIGVEQHQATAPTTSAIRILVKQGTTSLDRNFISVAIFR
jgi:endoglucanase Acf2